MRHRRFRRTSLTWRYLLPVVIILLLALWLRLAGLMKLPLFWIEGANLVRAHNALSGELFTGNVNIRKWLYPVILMLVQPGGPEGPWLARSLSGLMGVLSVAATVRLGCALGDRQIGWVAGLFYAVMPLAVFHERQILSDPLLAMFTTWATVLMIWLARRPRWWIGLLLGLILAAAFLTKISALLYLFMPFVAIWLLVGRKDMRRRALAGAVVALVIVGVAVGRVYQEAVEERSLDQGPLEILISSFTDLLPGADVLPGGERAGGDNRLSRLEKDIPTYFDLLWRYTGVASLILIGVSVVLILLRRNWRTLLFLFLPGFAFGFAPVIADRPDFYLPARYMTTLAAPLAVLVGLVLREVSGWVERWRVGSRPWASGIVWLAIFAQALWFDVALILDPAHAPLTRVDVYQYIEGAPSGYGYVEIAEVLLERWRQNPARHLNVLMTQPWEAVAAYLGPRVGDFYYVRPGDPQQTADVVRWLANGEALYFIESHPGSPLPKKPYGAELDYVAGFTSSLGPSAIYEVTAITGELVPYLYAYHTPPPETLANDYEALAQTINPGDMVFVFPDLYAGAFAAYTGQEAIPIAFERWSLTPDLATETLRDILPSQDAREVQVVLVDEANSDPQRILTAALNRMLYYLADDWSGLLHRWRYVTGPPEPATQPVGAVYENVITLEGVAILDPHPTPGAVVRFAMQWVSAVPVQDSFKIFVHIIGPDGQIQAQHDGIPGAGLLPMTAWEPGQPVVDRFAIRLPADLPPGEYEVRVGIYHPDSGLRLPVTEAAEKGPDYTIIGRLIVK